MKKLKKFDDNQKLEEMAFLGITPDLMNYFLDEQLRNTSCLRNITERYHRTMHPIANDIETIINATLSFRSATDLDFSSMRDQTLSNKSVLNNLNAMGKAIYDFAIKIKSELLNDTEQTIVNDALDYCKKSIAERLEKLRRNDDRVYKVYDNNENLLKTALRNYL